jgi:hypothetical protein
MIDVRAWIDISMCFGKKKQVLTQQLSFMFRYHTYFRAFWARAVRKLGWPGFLQGDAGHCHPQARFAPQGGGQVAMLDRRFKG